MVQERYTVLLVDDRPEDRETYRRYLLQDKQYAYKFLEADSGEEAIALCSKQFPDAIVLDFLMPDIDGLEVLGELKILRDTEDLPVVMLTGQGNEEVAVAALKGGASDYLIKGKTNAETLRLAIKYAIERDRVRQCTQQIAQRDRTNQELQTTLEELQVAEEELRQQNEELTATRQLLELERQHYQDLFESAPDGYLVTDVKGNIQQANRAAAALLGVEQDLLAGKPLIVYIAKADREAFQTQLTQLQQIRDWEISLKPRKGLPFPVAIAVNSINDERGQQVGWRWSMRDISQLQAALWECKQVEEGLRRSEEQRRLTLDLTHTAIWDWNIVTGETTWNENHYYLLGLEPGEVQPSYQAWRDRVFPEDIERVERAIAQALETHTDYEMEYCVVYPDGSLHWIMARGRGIYDHSGRAVRMVGMLFDIGERKAAEQKIKEQAALIDITSDAIIVRDLNSQILFWNRGAEQIFGWTATEAIGKKANEFLYKSISPQLESTVSTVVDRNFWHGELNKIGKSGRELIVESRWTLMRDETGQAKAILTVDTDITDKKQLEAQLHRAQRLESFGNTGLGLSVVASIVKNHGGFIDVNSEVGVGTQFKIFLPGVEAKEMLPQSKGKIPRGNGDWILVVDDEVAICETTKTTLETYGYRVLTASDGVEAVAQYAQHHQKIGAVLMDMMMPSMDGVMATRALQQINPSVKIIAVSGLISNEKITSDIDAIVHTFLSKPYTTDILLKTLYGVLKDYRSSE
jgi:PAS domain S-box-containing protein